nr:DUF1801 domain-containing protein [Micromonospora sp. DSM 115978]
LQQHLWQRPRTGGRRLVSPTTPAPDIPGRPIYTAAMAELKTQRNDSDVQAFLAGVDDERRRGDAQRLCAIMAEATGEAPVMWGTNIVGFGRSSYTLASGRSNDWFTVGFAPRKQNLALYLTGGFDRHADLLARLGKYTTGKSCLYVKSLAAVDVDALRELVAAAHAAAKSDTG